MEFQQFEKILYDIIIRNGLYAAYESELKKAGVIDTWIKHEEKIQASLGYWPESPVSEEDIKYAEEQVAKSSLWVVKIRYLLFLTKHLDKKCLTAKAFLEMVVQSPEELLLFENNPLTLSIIYKALLNYSTLTNLYRNDAWKLVNDYVTKQSDRLITLTESILKFIINEKSFSEAEQLFEVFYQNFLEAEKTLLQAKDFFTLERLYKEILAIKYNRIDKQNIQRRLAELYLQQAENEDSPVKGIYYSHKAAKMFKLLHDNDCETKSLSLVQKFAKMDHPDWERKYKLPEETSELFSTIIQTVIDIFTDKDIPFIDRLRLPGQYIYINELSPADGMQEIIYKPSESKVTIEAAYQGLGQSIARLLCSTITLNDGKVVSVGEDTMSRARSLAYSVHRLINIMPAMVGLEKSEDYSLEKIIQFIQNTEIVTSDEMVFLTEAFKDYENNRYIPFICIIVPCIESILRTLYFLLKGTDIQAQHSNPDIHTTVNLTDVLKDDKVRQRLSDDLVNYLEFLLNDSSSPENIRNNVAHRLKGNHFYSEERAKILLHVLLVICSRYQA